MDKQKFGKSFYIGSLIVALVVYIGVRLVLPKESLVDETYIRYSNLVNFSVFAFILPIGVMVREFYLLPYIKKIMISKIIIFSLVLIVSLILFFVLPTVSVSNLILYFSYGSLIFILIPSNSFRKFDKE